MTLSTSAVAVCCCSRFAQLIQQPRILDGDDGLGGEILHQGDLFVGEWTNLLARYTMHRSARAPLASAQQEGFEHHHFQRRDKPDRFALDVAGSVLKSAT